jgi:hypothetical protein
MKKYTLKISRKILFTIAHTVVLFLMAHNVVNAQSVIPTFPVCSNPTGTVKVSYESGTHGIAGQSGTVSGKDTVYQIDESTLVQCFCAEDGSGVQTNWWNAISLNQSEIDTLTNLGWVFVANGADWGLSNDPYMALNSTYSCKGSVNSSSTSSSGGSVAGTSSVGGVLGLATTGTSVQVASTVMIGLMFIFIGIALRKVE